MLADGANAAGRPDQRQRTDERLDDVGGCEAQRHPEALAVGEVDRHLGHDDHRQPQGPGAAR